MEAQSSVCSHNALSLYVEEERKHADLNTHVLVVAGHRRGLDYICLSPDGKNIAPCRLDNLSSLERIGTDEIRQKALRWCQPPYITLP